ncbi:MAG: antibiotic biosynthesis monooxygenase [Hamadaea sp.]|nr:antibiotic biosynthesis monooxygenase [Hamadaea sp.]
MTNNDAPVSLYGFLTPKPERAAEVRDILTALVEPSRSEPGNLAYHLHEQQDGRFFLYEVWRSQADLDAHNTHPPLQRFLAAIDDYLVAPPEAYAGGMISAYPAG